MWCAVRCLRTAHEVMPSESRGAPDQSLQAIPSSGQFSDVAKSFTDSGRLDDVEVAHETFTGLERVSVDGGSICKVLVGGGLPCTVDDLKRWLVDYLTTPPPEQGPEQGSGRGQMKPRVYVETSVVSYLTGRLSHDVSVLANQLARRDGWRYARARFELVGSRLVVQEAGVGDPQGSRDRLAALESLAVVHPSYSSEVLGRQLTQSHALPKKPVQDAAHIAIAVANGIEYLVTWNLRHIANATNASKIDQVCRDSGYRPTIICTPARLMEE